MKIEIGKKYYLKPYACKICIGKAMTSNEDVNVFRVFGMGLVDIEISRVLGLAQPSRTWWEWFLDN